MRWDIILTRVNPFPEKGLICVKWCKGGWVWAKVHLLQGYVCSQSSFAWIIVFWTLWKFIAIRPKRHKSRCNSRQLAQQELSPPTLRWLSEWQLWQEGGNELRAKEVRPIKLGLIITVAVGTLLCSGRFLWMPVYKDAHLLPKEHSWFETWCGIIIFQRRLWRCVVFGHLHEQTRWVLKN